MWGWDQGRPTLDPQTAGWPALSFYVNLALQHVQFVIGKITGRYGDRLDFFVDHVDPHTLLPTARLLSVFAGVAVVVVGFRLARRLSGGLGALTAGSLLAVSPLLIESSLKVAPDIFLTLFSALALTRFLDVYEKGRLRDYAWSGVWIALGAASKYTPILLVPCLLLAHLMRRWRDDRWRSLVDRRLLLAGGACALTFFAASPYTLLNAASAQRDIASQFSHVLVAGHFGHELQDIGYAFYLREALPAALGWPATALGLAGLGIAAWRRRGAWLVILFSFACYYLALGALRSLQAYYILPALLPVALGVAYLASELARATATRRRSLSVASGIGLLGLVLALPAVQATRQQMRYARPSTLREAKAFIMQELNGPDVYFAVEMGGPELPRGPKADFAQREVFGRLDAERRERLLRRVATNRYVINMYMTDPEGSDLYYDLRHYVGYDYVVISSKAHDRYVALRNRFPRQNAFYADLERTCELVRHFAASSDRLGPDVWIYRIDPAARRAVAERPPLTHGFHAPYMAKIRSQDLIPFLGLTGVLATNREDWRSADLYLTTLLELRADGWEEMLLPVAKVKCRAGDLAGAAELCREVLQRRPDDPEARALGAAIVDAVSGKAASGP